jgi:hypothetical protein
MRKGDSGGTDGCQEEQDRKNPAHERSFGRRRKNNPRR